MAQTIFIEVDVDFFLQVWAINIMKMHIIRILKNNKHYASKSSLLQIKDEVTQNMKFEYFTWNFNTVINNANLRSSDEFFMVLFW